MTAKHCVDGTNGGKVLYGSSKRSATNPTSVSFSEKDGTCFLLPHRIKLCFSIMVKRNGIGYEACVFKPLRLPKIVAPIMVYLRGVGGGGLGAGLFVIWLYWAGGGGGGGCNGKDPCHLNRWSKVDCHIHSSWGKENISKDVTYHNQSFVDICLISLPTKIQLGVTAKQIGLPPNASSEPKVGDQLTITGWGYACADPPTCNNQSRLPAYIQVSNLSYRLWPPITPASIPLINMELWKLCKLL